VLLAISVGLAGKVLWDKYQLGELNTTLNAQLMEANLELGKAGTQFGDAQDYINLLQKDLQKHIKDNDEILTRYGELEAEYTAVVDNVPATETVYVEGPTIEVPIELNLTRGMLYQAITSQVLAEIPKIFSIYEDHRVSIGCAVRSRPNRDRKIPVFISYALKLKIRGQIVEARTASGAVNYYLNLFELDHEGNDVGKFKLTKFDVVVQKPGEKQFFWFAPYLDLGGSIGIDTDVSFSASLSAGVSFMGYGHTKNDLSWRFLHLGAELSNDSIGLSFAPAQWNIGDVIPLVRNLWIAPQGAIFTDGRKSLGLQLTVGL